MTADLAERIATKSDAELLQILLRDAAQYRPEVLELAAREAAVRGLSLELPEEDSAAQADDSDVTKPSAEEQPPGYVYYAAGRVVICPHCAGKRFFQRRVLLNTRILTLIHLDWLNAGAYALTCLSCRRIEWFSHVESRLEELSEPPSSSS